MATIDIAMESTSQQILNKLNASSSNSGYVPGIKTFTSNGTFTVPAGVYKINVTACGGGGGGGGADGWSSWQGGGGGGGALINKYPFSVTPGQQIAITIGAGGAAGTVSWGGSPASASDGGNGGSTVIGSLVTLPGGYGGRFSHGGGHGGAGAGGGATSYKQDCIPGRGFQDGNSWHIEAVYGQGGTATPNYFWSKWTGIGGSSVTGAKGGSGFEYSIGYFGNGGGGGGASLGDGGNGAGWYSDTVCKAATAAGYGGGGGGGYSYNSSKKYASSKGGAGVVIIEW